MFKLTAVTNFFLNCLIWTNLLITAYFDIRVDKRQINLLIC